MSNQNQSRDQKEQKHSHQFRDGDRVKVRCVEYELGFTSGDNGAEKEQLGLALDVTDGPAKGYTLSCYLFFTEAAAEYSLKKMAALGWDGDWGNLESLKKDEAVATIEIERDRDGKEQVRVGWINRAGVAMKNKMNPTQRASFAQRMQALSRRVLGTDAGGNDDRRLGNEGRRGSYREEPRDQGGYDYRREQQSYNGRGRDDREPPPPSDDDKPPYERGRRW